MIDSVFISSSSSLLWIWLVWIWEEWFWWFDFRLCDGCWNGMKGWLKEEEDEEDEEVGWKDKNGMNLVK